MLAQILYTSGTESLPKGAMLTHESVIAQYVSVMVAAEYSATDTMLHAMPLFHCAQLDTFFGPMLYNGASNVIIPAPVPETVLACIERDRITSFFAPPTVWISLLRSPAFDRHDLSSLKKCYYGASIMPVAILQEMQQRLPAARFWNIYGQTEICGIAVVHRDDDIAFNTVGTPIAGTEIKIDDNGEILLRSASVFKGYHRNPAATAEAVDPEGWLHTGDAGYLDDNGHLVVIDRQKDVLTTADGTRFSSAFIENKLKFSPYVEEAVTFAADNGMTAIITIDPMTTGSWAEHERLSYTTYTDLAAKAEVQDLVAEEIHRANEDLPESIRVQRFVLLHKQFDPDDDEITRTRKVRRNVIQDRYGLIIDALNRGDERIGITTTVTYQDGTKVDRTIDLRIYDLTSYRVPEGRGRRPVWSGRR